MSGVKNTLPDFTVKSLHQWLSNFQCASELPGGLVQIALGLTPELLIHCIWDRAQEFAFLTGSQVMLGLAGGLRTIF